MHRDVALHVCLREVLTLLYATTFEDKRGKRKTIESMTFIEQRDR